jgi:hypothetical protein
MLLLLLLMLLLGRGAIGRRTSLRLSARGVPRSQPCAKLC